MAPKEESNKAKSGTVTVNIDDFTKTRDSVLYSLAQLNSAVADLSRAYINHSNTVLGRDPGAIDLGIISSGITNSLHEHGLITRPSSPGAKSEAGGDKKKQRKRAPHDPKAPKRALTPFFLYMQNNRPEIARDLGPNAKPKEVSAEGTNRWANMAEPQKAVWKGIYLENLAKYRKEMDAYKEKKEKGLPIGDDDHDDAASQLQQDVETAEASQAESDEGESEAEEEEGESSTSPEPRKEPSPPRSGKRRRSDAAKTPKATESPAANKSPEKKKRGASKKDKEEEAPPASARKNATAESKRPKKKRKSEINDE